MTDLQVKTALISTFQVFSKSVVPVPSTADCHGQASWPPPTGTISSWDHLFWGPSPQSVRIDASYRVITRMEHKPPAGFDPRKNRSPPSHCPTLYNNLFRGEFLTSYKGRPKLSSWMLNKSVSPSSCSPKQTWKLKHTFAFKSYLAKLSIRIITFRRGYLYNTT